jgi:hypothetical protein
MASSQGQIGTRTGNGRRLSPTFFFTSFTKHCLKQKFSWQVILLLDGYRAPCSSPLMLQSAAKNNTAIIRLPSQCIHTVLPLNKCFLCLERVISKTIIRYHMARLTGFAWSKAASVCVGVSAFESTGIYLWNVNRMPEYFSISDTGQTITSVATERPNMAPVGVASTS